MAIYSVTVVLWKEIAFPLCRAMERRWERNVVSRVSSVTVVIRHYYYYYYHYYHYYCYYYYYYNYFTLSCDFLNCNRC